MVVETKKSLNRSQTSVFFKDKCCYWSCCLTMVQGYSRREQDLVVI